MAHRLAQRLHNPRGRTCGCAPECWCRRTRIGRAVKWWFPAGWFGIRHVGPGSADWKRRQDVRPAS